MSLLLTIFIVFLIVSDYFITKKDFHRKIYPVLLEINNGGSLRYLLDDYYFEHGQYPVSLNEIDSIYFKSSKQNLNISRKRALIDPFSKKGEYYYYQPVYDRNTRLREKYIALSRGIDGKINNVFNDTLFLDDSVHIMDYLNGKFHGAPGDVKFHFGDKYFGKKDNNLNPFYISGIELMEMQVHHCINVKQLLENMNENIDWKVTCLKCAKDKIKQITREKLLYSGKGIYIVIHLKTPLPRNIKQDTIHILGVVKNKIHNDTIVLNHALLYAPLQ